MKITFTNSLLTLLFFCLSEFALIFLNENKMRTKAIYVDGVFKPFENFLKQVERGEYESYVNDIVLSEVLLNFVKSELFRLRGIKPHRVVQEIKG